MIDVKSLKLKLTDNQERFIDTPKKYTAFIGGVGSGKTYAGITKAMLCAMRVVCNGAIVAPTYRMLKDTILPVLREKLEGMVIEERLSDMVWVLTNGSMIYLRSAEDPDHFRGLNLNWILIEEAPYCSSYIWPVAIGRLRQEVRDGDGVIYPPCAFVTGTPKGRNWVYQFFAKDGGKTNEYGMVQASSMSNPFLSKDYLNSLKLNYTGKYFAQELLGEFVTFEGLIYDTFDEDIHLWSVKKHGLIPTGRDVELYEYGLDTNYAKPCAITVHCIPTVGPGKFIKQGRAYDIQIDEWYVSKASTREVAAQLRKFYAMYGRGIIYTDPSDPRMISDLSEFDLDVRRADNSVLAGIRLEQDAWTLVNNEPGAFITSNCIHTRAELATYCWAAKGRGLSDVFLNRPVKEFDHLMDARRYRRLSGVHGGLSSEPAFSNEPVWGEMIESEIP